jgi:hypothetical protein
MTKTCTKCKKEKVLDCFSTCRGVINSWCKDCMNTYHKRNYLQRKARDEKNKEQRAEQKKKMEELGASKVDVSKIKDKCIKCGKRLEMSKLRYYKHGNYCNRCY